MEQNDEHDRLVLDIEEARDYNECVVHDGYEPENHPHLPDFKATYFDDEDGESKNGQAQVEIERGYLLNVLERQFIACLLVGCLGAIRSASYDFGVILSMMHASYCFGCVILQRRGVYHQWCWNTFNWITPICDARRS